MMLLGMGPCWVGERQEGKLSMSAELAITDCVVVGLDYVIDMSSFESVVVVVVGRGMRMLRTIQIFPRRALQ